MFKITPVYVKGQINLIVKIGEQRERKKETERDREKKEIKRKRKKREIERECEERKRNVTVNHVP